MKKIFAFLFFILAMYSFAFSQSPLPTLEKVKQLKLLESTQEDAIKLLNNEDVGHGGGSYFYAEDANVIVYYSSGDCSGEYEDWNVSEDKITDIAVSPKGFVKLKDLGIDYTKFRRERPRNDYKKLYVYHDKKAGVTIWVYGERVESVIFSPPEKDFPLLCNKTEVKNYYSSKQYVRDPDMKNATYHNFPPPDVTHLDLSRNELIICDTTNRNKNCADNKISVSTTITNYMNDTVVYDYRISGGKIIGTGEKVVWDLSGVKPGIYKITAIADNGLGPAGRWITQTVTVKECPDCR